MIYLAWSGGLDSTYALVELLRRGYSVHAHHVSVIWGQRFATGEEQRRLALDRAEAELSACVAIRERLLADGFSFGFSTSRVDWRDRQMRIADDMGTMPHVLNEAMIRNVQGTDRIVYGANDEDYPEGAPLEKWRSLVGAHCDWVGVHPPPVVRFGQWQSRAAHVAALGLDLANLTMSCRRPKMIDGEWTPCGSRKKFTSRWTKRWPHARACTCEKLIDLIPRYADGWAKDETIAPRMMSVFRFLTDDEVGAILSHMTTPPKPLRNPIPTRRQTVYPAPPELERQIIDRGEGMFGTPEWEVDPELRINRYNDGDWMRWHEDGSIKGSTTMTLLSMVRPSDSGTLEIDGMGEVHLKPGEAIAYPYPTRHRVTEISGGPRYTCSILFYQRQG